MYLFILHLILHIKYWYIEYIYINKCHNALKGFDSRISVTLKGLESLLFQFVLYKLIKCTFLERCLRFLRRCFNMKWDAEYVRTSKIMFVAHFKAPSQYSTEETEKNHGYESWCLTLRDWKCQQLYLELRDITWKRSGENYTKSYKTCMLHLIPLGWLNQEEYRAFRGNKKCIQNVDSKA